MYIKIGGMKMKNIMKQLLEVKESIVSMISIMVAHSIGIGVLIYDSSVILDIIINHNIEKYSILCIIGSVFILIASFITYSKSLDIIKFNMIRKLMYKNNMKYDRYMNNGRNKEDQEKCERYKLIEHQIAKIMMDIFESVTAIFSITVSLVYSFIINEYIFYILLAYVIADSFIMLSLCYYNKNKNNIIDHEKFKKCDMIVSWLVKFIIMNKFHTHNESLYFFILTIFIASINIYSFYGIVYSLSKIKRSDIKECNEGIKFFQ